MSFGDHSATGPGAFDVFAAALDSTLEWMWVVGLGTTTDDEPGAIARWGDGVLLPITQGEGSSARGRLVAIDRAGMVGSDLRFEGDTGSLNAVSTTDRTWVAVGRSCGTTRVGSISAVASAGCDALVVAGPAGSAEGALTIDRMAAYGGTGDQRAFRVTALQSSVVVGGRFASAASLGTMTLTANGSADAFVHRMSIE